MWLSESFQFINYERTQQSATVSAVQLLYTKLLLSTQYTNILLSTQSTCDPSGVTDQTSDSWLKDLMLGSRDERPTSASTPARAVGDRHLAPRVIEHRR